MSKTVTESDIYCYAGLCGDFNPGHINAEFVKTSIFKECIAHGMLSAGFISAVLGTALPGKNAIYLKQKLVFQSPIKIGDTVTATVKVFKKIDAKNRLILESTVTNQTGTVVIAGKAIVMKSE